MKSFVLLTPHSAQEAGQLYARYAEAGCMYISGGTDVIPAIRKGVQTPGYLIDLREVVPTAITEEKEHIRIGAAATNKAVSESELIKTRFPALAMAAGSIGCVQTRGLATIGGNMCAALPSADTAPALYALEARMEILGEHGVRTVSAAEFLVGPRKNCMSPGEILLSILLPKAEEGMASHFIKFGRRNALSLSIVNEAVALRLNGERIETARIAIGACAPTPVYAPTDCLDGKRLSEIDEDAVKAAVASAIRPISDLRASAEYRRELAAALVCKSLRALTGRADEKDIVLRGYV